LAAQENIKLYPGKIKVEENPFKIEIVKKSTALALELLNKFSLP
jgi:hypothetical protein